MQGLLASTLVIFGTLLCLARCQPSVPPGLTNRPQTGPPFASEPPNGESTSFVPPGLGGEIPGRGPPDPPGGRPDVPGQGVGPPREPPRRGSPPPRQELDDQYVIVFNRGRSEQAVNSFVANLPSQAQAAVLRRFRVGNFRAAKARIPPGQLNRLRQAADVEYIEPEQGYEPGVCVAQQNPPTWNLRRISQRQPDLSLPYSYSSTQGAGAAIYVIDTGVNINHWEFGGRATWGTNTVDAVNSDCFNHGTHVAAIAAGTFVGVAKQASVIAVKVLSCTGWATTSTILDGISWAINDSIANRPRPAIINMSLGGPFSQAINDAVTSGVSDGIFFAVSAGNLFQNACNYSPSSTMQAVVVGASQLTSFGNGSFFDSFAPFSNYGPCLDILAPGVNILSAGNRSTIDYTVMSGTSMAAPHISGLAALLLGNSPTLTPAQLTTQIMAQATVVPISYTAPRTGPNIVAYHQCT